MIVGVPRESQPGERRVGLSPTGVAELSEQGARVVVECGAGAGAHFSDKDYQEAGGQIVLSHDEAFQRADVVCKVARVTGDDAALLREGQVVTGFQHLITAPQSLLQTLVTKRVTAISYEQIEEPDGGHPVLGPTSQIAGKMVPQLAGRLLQRGRGTLLGGIPGIPPADVVILGAGTLGYYAARSLRGAGATVYIMEKGRRLEELDRLFGGSVVTALATRANIEKFVRFADVLVGAVLAPTGLAPVLVTREMVRSMEPGAVVMDFSIDTGGCIETSRLTPSEEYVYLEEGVWHFCMPNVSSLVARTASHALTNAALPYLRALTERGLVESLRTMPDLAKGVSVYAGKVTQEYLAREQVLEYSPLERLL
ncbi:MAG: alanine dehydrogenase [Dehalococcoidia bacterium]|nr:alanine dehydrogenase [Dehalococcoidia bacterium]